MSVLGNAKANRHRKTHEVESGDASRQSWRLTRGDLLDESRRGVSRGHSSKDRRETAWSEGPKDHETDHSTTFMDAPGVFRNGRTRPRWQSTGPVVERSAGGFRQEATPREASEATSGGGSKTVLHEDLMETIVESDNLRRAFRQVKANPGAAGVAGMTVETFADHAREHWPVIKAKLEDGSYRPGAVRGVRMPKPKGGERRLGIPPVQDRLIQQAVRQVLTPGFEPEFSAPSYGYRPGRIFPLLGSTKFRIIY